MSTPALEIRDVDKRFGATIALDHAALLLRSGTVHALLGENGAGKTTLMRIAYGLLQPDAGTLAMSGHTVRFRGPHEAIAAGVGMVHQHFTNVQRMTVAENVALGGSGRYDASVAAERVRRVGDEASLHLDPTVRAEQLPVSAQQRLEIVKALASNARILIMDEPTAVLAPTEAHELLQWLRGFADRGNAAVLITHKLAEALSVADEVTVLRRGRTVLQRSSGGLTEEELADAMLGGRSTSSSASSGTPMAGDVVVRADRVCLHDERGVVRVRDATFSVRAGEIVGVAAVEGSGQRELLRALARRAPVAAGTLELPTRVGFVPEDRHRDALVLDFSLTENVALHGAGTRRGVMSWSALASRTADILREFDVRAIGPEAPARTLSGGNQQRLVLGRELDARPAALVVENPTRGLDLNATADVHARLRESASSGMAIVMHSNDLDEVLSLATRVFALHAGRLSEVPVNRERAGKAMLGLE